MPPSQEMLQVDDEPGRVSTEEAVISEGPYARQMVFFRSTEPPGTVVIHTSERFAYVVQGNNRALRYGIGVGREGFQWSDSSGSAARPSGRLAPAAGDDRAPALSPRFMAGGPAIRWAPARSISARRSSASTAPTSRRRSAMPSRPAASGWPTATSSIFYDRAPVGTKVVVRHGASLRRFRPLQAGCATFRSTEVKDHAECGQSPCPLRRRRACGRHPLRRDGAGAAGTLETVRQRGAALWRQRGTLRFSEQNSRGEWSGRRRLLSRGRRRHLR